MDINNWYQLLKFNLPTSSPIIASSVGMESIFQSIADDSLIKYFANM